MITNSLKPFVHVAEYMNEIMSEIMNEIMIVFKSELPVQIIAFEFHASRSPQCDTNRFSPEGTSAGFTQGLTQTEYSSAFFP